MAGGRWDGIELIWWVGNGGCIGRQADRLEGPSLVGYAIGWDLLGDECKSSRCEQDSSVVVKISKVNLFGGLMICTISL